MDSNHKNFIELEESENLIIVQQNIRSLRANFDTFIAELETWTRYPDVIILTEVWINSEESYLYSLSNYKSIFNCNDNYRAGGVVIYIKNDITINSHDIYTFNSADCISVTLKSNKLNVCIIAIYRHYQKSIQAFIDELQGFIMKSNNFTNERNVIMLGDLNINLLENSLAVENYKTLLACCGLESIINIPTRVTVKSQTCIDHVFAKINNKQIITYGARVIDARITDHSMTAVWMRESTTIAAKQLIGEASIGGTSQSAARRIDYATLNRLLGTEDWKSVYNCKDASVAYDNFVGVIQDFISKSWRVIKRKNFKKLKPWVTELVCKKINKRNRLLQKLKREPNNNDLRYSFKKMRNDLQMEIRNLKNKYYAASFNKCLGDSKKTWEVLNEITNQKIKGDNECVAKIVDNGKEIENLKEIANVFNKFFLSVSDKLHAGVNIPDDFYRLPYNNVFTSNSQNSSMFLYSVSKEEVEKVVKSLKNNKSPGIDNISSFLVKNIFPKIGDVLTYIINLSFSTGIFPEKLKEALVIPIFKSNSKELCNNYRPISLLSCFSKVIEKLMKVRLINYLDRIHFFSSNQYGFRSGMNTEAALNNFMKQVSGGVNDGKRVSGLFLDIKKAFDTVEHEVLLSKMYSSGIRGIVLHWFESYLTNRTQSVKIKNEYSEKGIIRYGVPQGSVLGAILFIIFINDLCSGRFNGKVTSFADDTALSYVADSCEEIQQCMNEDLMYLRWWFVNNKMFLSPEKTSYINFSLRGKVLLNHPIKYKCLDCLCKMSFCDGNCVIINCNDSIKYLGIILDGELKWKKYIIALSKKINPVLRLIFLLKPFAPISVLRSVYFSLIYSRLSYGILCWGGTYFSNLKAIIVKQKRIIRTILNKSMTEPSMPLFKELKILPLRYIYVYKVLRAFYERSGNIFNNEVDYKDKLRTRNNLFIPKPTVTYFKKTIEYLGPKIFNSLPKDIKETRGKNRFLKQVRNWLFELENVEPLLNV